MLFHWRNQLPWPGIVLQRLDHFDPRNQATWQQRYWTNDTYYRPGGPVFRTCGFLFSLLLMMRLMIRDMSWSEIRSGNDGEAAVANRAGSSVDEDDGSCILTPLWMMFVCLCYSPSRWRGSGIGDWRRYAEQLPHCPSCTESKANHSIVTSRWTFRAEWVCPAL